MTPQTTACQASLSTTNSRSLPKLMSIELVMPSNHLILCCPLSFCPQSFPSSGPFQMSQLFTSGGQSIGVSFKEYYFFPALSPTMLLFSFFLVIVLVFSQIHLVCFYSFLSLLYSSLLDEYTSALLECTFHSCFTPFRGS